MPVTLRDIAELAGLSPPTVCRALQDSPRVSPTTRRRVQELASKMKYQPNVLARSLRTQQVHNIGLIVPVPVAHHQAPFGFPLGHLSWRLDPLAAQVKQQDMNLMIDLEEIAAPLNSDEVGELPKMLAERHVAGVIVTSHITHVLAQRLADLDLPFVVVEGPRLPGMCTVNVHEDKNTELLVNHLADLGHRRIAFINSPVDNGFRTRLLPMGYVRAMSDRGLVPVPGWELHRLEEEQIEALWRQPQPPTAIITYDDYDVGQFMRWLNYRGLRVPGDVSLASTNALPGGDNFPIRLTRTTRPYEQIAREAVERLMRMINDPGSQPESVSFDPQLEVGESTGPCREE